MLSESITAGARTVTSVEQHFAELRGRALKMKQEGAASERGYFIPAEEEQVFQLLVSYTSARNALLELVQSFRLDTELPAEKRPAAFLVGFAAALLLIDAARFLRDSFHDRPVVRSKLNDPEPHFGVHAGTYDAIQASLTNPRNAWHLYHAMKYYEEHRDELSALGQTEPLRDVHRIATRLVERLRVSMADYARARLRHRLCQAVTVVRRDGIHRALYGLQRFAGQLVSGVYTVPHHRPHLPAHVVQELRAMLRPGDVLVTRKEYAITNYFLPGFWPHAALYLGTVNELQALGLAEHVHAKPRWLRLLECDHSEPARVLESLKDGVLFRSLSSPIGNDAIAVLRPQLNSSEIATALGRSFFHEGKLYDFDFDFTRSDRLVCSEVVYRSYDRVGGIEFRLVRRAGRLTLAPEDLLEMALAHECFQPVAAFVPSRVEGLVSGPAAEELVRSTCSPQRAS